MESYGRCIINLKKLPNFFEMLYHFTEIYEGASYSTSLTACGICMPLNFSYFNVYIMVSCYGLNLHFPDYAEHLFICLIAICISSFMNRACY